MPKLDITKLNAELKRKEIRPVYAVVGDELHLVSGALKIITDAVMGGGAESQSPAQFMGKEVDAEKINDTLRSVSMFSQNNLVIIREADKLKKDVAEFLAVYCARPAPNSTLILEAEKLDGRSKFMRAIEQNGAVVECKALYSNQIPSWINMEAGRHGKKISQEAAKFLADMIGNDLGQLKMSLDRLAIYVGNRALIELKDVEEAVAETAQRTVFELSDAIGMKQVDKAVSTLRNLLDAGQSPVFILNMIARHIRILTKAREIGGRIDSTPELAKYLGVHPFYANNYMSQSKNFSAGDLRKFFNLLSKCDRSLKSSRLPKERILEKLIFELCGKKNAVLKARRSNA